MIVWFPENGNVYEAQVLYEIETTKADILYAEMGISSLISKISVVEYNMSVLKSNLSYLKKNAIIVSMREYIKITFQMAGLAEQKVEKERTLRDLQKKKEELTQRLKELESRLEQVKFKVLEFKKRG